jgi:hypothetical protein
MISRRHDLTKSQPQCHDGRGRSDHFVITHDTLAATPATHASTEAPSAAALTATPLAAMVVHSVATQPGWRCMVWACTSPRPMATSLQQAPGAVSSEAKEKGGRGGTDMRGGGRLNGGGGGGDVKRRKSDWPQATKAAPA